MSLENTTDPVIPDPEVTAEVPPADAAPAAAASEAPAREMPSGDPPRGAIAEWALTILLLLFLTTTLVQAYVIPSGSMEDTLLIGDHLLVDKLAYAPSGPVSKYILPYSDVRRGDIIVFRYPEDIRMTFVKRAIGIPGDRIRLVNKEVYRNGVKIDEPYTVHKSDYLDPYRDNSSDSRFWGFVPRRNIIGKPLIIYWSYDGTTDQLQENGISPNHVVDLVKNFFPKTRWTRTFKLIHGYASR